jgi:predicted RNase H-like HicB family nuclease
MNSRISVALEEGPDRATLAHALSLPGCVALGRSPERALDALATTVNDWLGFLEGIGEPVPDRDAELELAVDEWVRTDVSVAGGESDAAFEADFEELSDEEVQRLVLRLGELRSRLLVLLRELPREGMDRIAAGEFSVRQALDELGRGTWWTLSRLGASPPAELPDDTMGRLDTAMALAVHSFANLAPAGPALELEGELWTPRKVLRRLLWLEWSVGRVVHRALTSG